MKAKKPTYECPHCGREWPIGELCICPQTLIELGYLKVNKKEEGEDEANHSSDG
jgi:hypothetical protein